LGFTLAASAGIVAVPQANDWLGTYADKIRRLEQVPAPRMVFIGGSGLAFGLNSAEVEQTFGMPVVNTGLHAGLGLRFMLNHVGPLLRAGDIAVVVPEYGSLQEHDSEDRELWCTALLSDIPESLHGVTAEDVPEVLGGFPPYAQQKLIIEPILKLLRSRGARHDYVSSRATFDVRGDEVGHLAAPQPSHHFDTHLETDVEGHVAMLRKFATDAEARGVKVGVAFQALDVDVFEKNRQQVARIADVLRRVLGDRVMGTPEEATLPDEAIFDTPNHANAVGRELNTARLVREISMWRGPS
jgi:hypothetical protein